MCGRYGLYRDPSPQATRLHARLPNDFTFVPHYNVAPRQSILAATQGERRVVAMRWGLRDPFPRADGKRRSTINARIETLATSPLYGPLLARRRCAIFADGYYEWPAGEPVWIGDAAGTPLVFAGRYEADGPEPTCTIVTRVPDPALAHVHDRMPAVLDDALANAWLAAETRDARAALDVLDAQRARAWSVRRVGRAVGDVRRDDPSLLEPPAQASLFETGAG